MVVEWNAENAAHLLRRATFGARPKDVTKALNKGMAATIGGLFKKPESDAFPGGFKDVYLDQLQAWWVRRMLSTKAPLAEKLTLMWHNHFATGYSKIEFARFMHVQNQALRKHCLGKYRDLVEGVSKSAAMSIWLDGQTNTAEDPNENFARELMELFTTGVLDKTGAPNYTEQDVEQAARAFTGWSYTYPKGEFVLYEYDHDFGPKTFKGQTQSFEGEDIIAILTAEAATARRVAWRLWTTFAYPVELDDAVLDSLEQVYLANDEELRPVVEAMFNKDEFYSPTAKNAHVKSPAEFLVGAMRLLRGKFNDKKYWMDYDVAYAIRLLGQSVFDPPTVFGWKEDTGWTSSNGVFGRLQYGSEIAYSQDFSYQTFVWQPKKVLPPKSQWGGMDAAATVQWLLDQLGPLSVSSSTFDAYVAYLGTDEDGVPATFVLNEQTVDSKVRGLIALMLASPEFQLA
jgi:uncharacterized protein (DUF1800 family)